MDDLVRVLTERRSEIAAEIGRQAADTEASRQIGLSAATLTQASNQFMGIFLDSLSTNSSGYLEACRQLAIRRVQQGTPITGLLDLFRLTDQVMIQTLQSTLSAEPAVAIDSIRRCLALTGEGRQAMTETFVATREEVIASQQQTLRELSTPIVPVRQGILVLPIVGGIDSQRANQIIEAALEQITAQQADVLIIDITGVPMVDSGVANYIIQTARAVRLLGAQVILVGISAAVAQSIVGLGIDMSNITPRANLQSAIELALIQQGLAIQPVPAEAALAEA